MTTIAFIGAGSATFTRRLVGDILSFPALEGSRVVLHDVDEVRLGTADRLARNLARTAGRHLDIVTTTDRRRALAGASYVVLLLQVGGLEAVRLDTDIPARFGLLQTIADSYGIGGIVRALRTVPVLLDICTDAHDVGDHPLVLSHVNPMGTTCWAMSAASSLPVVGLCHSIPYTANYLARDLGIERHAVAYTAAGLNHLAFFLRFEHKGENLMPRLHRLYLEGKAPTKNRLRYEVLAQLGWFVSESSEHFAEYTPWFFKRDRHDLVENFGIPIDDFERRAALRDQEWRDIVDDLDAGRPLEAKRSEEFTIPIIDSLETGERRTVYVNVPNRDLVTNLPADAVVEIPCTVDSDGLRPHCVGPLPPVLAGLLAPHVAVQRLVVDAVLHGRLRSVYEAAVLDPRVGAELDLRQIRTMVDLLVEAHELPLRDEVAFVAEAVRP